MLKLLVLVEEKEENFFRKDIYHPSDSNAENLISYYELKQWLL